MTEALSANERINLLRLNSFLGVASPDFLCGVADAATEWSYQAGEFVFAKNEAATGFFVLIDGAIEHPEIRTSCVDAAGVNRFSTTGQIFGFAAVVPGQPVRVASALCATPARALRIAGPWFQKYCESFGSSGYVLLQELIRTHAGYERATLGRPGWISLRNAGIGCAEDQPQPFGINDCSLEIRAGECCAIVGAPSLGLTAFVDAIAGEKRVASGAIYLDGELLNWPGAVPKRSINAPVVSSKALLKRRLTVAQNLDHALRQHDPSRAGTAATTVAALLERFHLSAVAESLPGELLPSTVRCVQILHGLVQAPRVMIVDNPCGGLDDHGRRFVHLFIADLLRLERDRTIVLTSESVDEARQWTERVLILDPHSGQIVPHDIVEPPVATRIRATFADGTPPLPDSRAGSAAAAANAIAERQLASNEPGDAAGSVDPLVTPCPTGINVFRESIRNGRFFWSVEFIPSRDKVLRDQLQKLGDVSHLMRQDPSLAGFTVTDRVHSDRDPDPVAAASHLLHHSGRQPLVHLSGKDREIEDLVEALGRMRLSGLQNMLVVTGDRVKEQPSGRRVRYLESVAAIQVAKRLGPDMFIGAVVNPFKYREEDAMAQYLKLGKKVAAGADFIVTQIGFDMLKYEEALYWVNARGYRVPLVANVMPMTAARARYIRKHQLAGVTVTDSFLALLEAEERLLSDKGDSRVLRRLALQVIGLQQIGYAGVQLTAIHSAAKLTALRVHVAELADLCSDRASWSRAWQEAFTLPEQGRADPVPGNAPWYLAGDRLRQASRREIWKYRLMASVHGLVFGQGFAAAMAGRLVRRVARNTVPDALLVGIERIVKTKLFGCETCGSCRLAATQYVCPETCPKGLANGSCGGTTDNLCEFRDRECVHSIKYRIAKAAGQLGDLEHCLIPAVSRATRNTSSWPPHFRGDAWPVRIVRQGKAQPSLLPWPGAAETVADSAQ